MVEISLLTESDRASWEVLARGHHGHFETEVGDDSYEQAFERVLDGVQARGIAAWVDGAMVGIERLLAVPQAFQSKSASPSFPSKPLSRSVCPLLLCGASGSPVIAAPMVVSPRAA